MAVFSKPYIILSDANPIATGRQIRVMTKHITHYFVKVGTPSDILNEATKFADIQSKTTLVYLTTGATLEVTESPEQLDILLS